MIKKIAIILLTYVLIISSSVVLIRAQENLDFNYYISEWNNKVYITEYHGSNPNIIIPSEIEGKPVEGISSFRCTNIQEVESITIPKNISNIYDLADISIKEIIVAQDNDNFIVENGVLYSKDYSSMIKCSSLRDNIEFKSETSSIKAGCFYGSNIIKLTIPESVTYIESSAFNHMNQLKILEIKGKSNNGYITDNDGNKEYLLQLDLEGIDEIDSLILGRDAVNVKGLKPKIRDIVVDNDNKNNILENGILYTKDYYCLKKCSTQINSITVNERTKQLDDYCFNGVKISSLIIPNTVEFIYNANVFLGMDNLKKLELYTEFAGNDQNLKSTLESLTVNCITEFNFDNYKNLKEINFLEGITAVTEGFSGCSSLEKIFLPASVVEFSPSAFFYCENLREINVDEKNTVFHSENGVVYKENELVAYPSGKNVTKVEVGEDVNYIGDNAFSTNKYINEVILSDSIKIIGKEAFWECSSLNKAILPNNLEEIGVSTFLDCTNLKEVNIPKYIKTLYESKYDVRVDRYREQAGERNIIYGTLYIFKGCESLEKINLDPQNKYFIMDNNCLYTSDYSILIKNLNREITTFSANEKTKCIEIEALSNCKNLINIDLKNVTDIMYKSFDNCTSLERIDWPNVAHFGIGGNFYRCTALEKIVLPKTLTKIDSYFPIFDGCTALKDVNLSNIKEYMTDTMYSNCENLKKIILPKSIIEQKIMYIDDKMIYYVYQDSYALKNIEELNDLIASGNYWHHNLIKYKIIDELVDKNTNIIVDSGNCNNISKSLQLVVKEINDGNDYDYVLDGLERFKMYDISLIDDAGEILLDGNCIVKIPVAKDMNIDNCKVYYLNDIGEYEDMNANYQDGFMVFNTSHFSKYIVSDSKLNIAKLGDVNNDGEITYLDAVLVLQNDSGENKLSASQIKAADMNSDGVVNYNDAVLILKYDAGIIN